MTSRIREKMDQKEGEGEEVREEKKLKESLQIYVYRFVERRKTARVPLALLHEKGERNRRRQARRQVTLTTAVASCRVFRIVFVISLNFLYLSSLLNSTL